MLDTMPPLTASGEMIIKTRRKSEEKKRKADIRVIVPFIRLLVVVAYALGEPISTRHGIFLGRRHVAVES